MRIKFSLDLVWEENKAKSVHENAKDFSPWCTAFFFLCLHNWHLSFPSAEDLWKRSPSQCMCLSYNRLGGGRFIILLWRLLNKLFWNNFRIKRVGMTVHPVSLLMFHWLWCHPSLWEPTVIGGLGDPFKTRLSTRHSRISNSSSVSFLEGRTFSNLIIQLASRRQGEL